MKNLCILSLIFGLMVDVRLLADEMCDENEILMNHEESNNDYDFLNEILISDIEQFTSRIRSLNLSNDYGIDFSGRFKGLSLDLCIKTDNVSDSFSIAMEGMKNYLRSTHNATLSVKSKCNMISNNKNMLFL